jgi:hypothetical protein
LVSEKYIDDYGLFSDNKEDGFGREFKTSATVSVHSVSNFGYSYE